jgi:hypothetical protein
MPEPDSARELYRVIAQHVRGDGSKKNAYVKQRLALRKKVGSDAQMPPCVRGRATLGRCSDYLRQRAGNAVKRRLDLLKSEFGPLLGAAAPAKTAKTPPPAPDPAPALGIFISHSSDDEKLAEAVVDLLRAAFGLARESIRCTSVPGYQLPGGASIDDKIRREIVAAKVFIALITPASLRSIYVLFELGARWSLDLETSVLIPLVAGMRKGDVPAPLSSLNAIDTANQNEMHDFVEQIAKWLKINVPKAGDYVRQLGKVTETAVAARPALSKYSQRIMRALFGEEKGRALDRYLTDPKYEAAVGELQKKGLVTRSDKRYRLTEAGSDAARKLWPMV